ncbi:MAG: GAF domain-containing protein [Hyphomicrobiaceae bacterium]|nr:GAF domain-containing protein [Hyphomicrobiaceae bacterium]
MSQRILKVDLTNCDREPIHTPGSIQPHGVLLVCDVNDNLITAASANAAAFLGGQRNHVVGLTLADILGGDVAHNLRNAIARAGGSHLAGAELGVQLQSGQVVDASIHRHNDRIFVELEPTSQSRGEAKSALDLTQALVRRISKETEVEALAASGAKLVRALLGYDRVMVYRFLHNGAGKVIAEAKRHDLHSFMGQYFPASDIPDQARRLYLLNWIRLIADVSYEPVTMAPADGHGTLPDIDMSHAHLRSVSPIHCEYLRNMGVAASLSISIVVEGKLWGLIACHHNTPKLVPLPMRVSAELFAQYYSLQIAIAERRAEYLASAKARRRLDDIITSLDPAEPVDTGLVELLPALAELIACDGAALWLGDVWHTTGVAPGREAAAEITAFLKEHAQDAIWSTEDLRTLLGSGKGYGERVAGLLAIPISGQSGDFLIYFRSEEAHKIEWAGEPVKQVVEGPQGPRLTPRGSFETWREDVRWRSTPWTDPEFAVAEATRTYLRDVILRFKEATADERSRADRRRRLLNDELNHRVKNIIALVKSLALQTGSSSSTVDDYSRALEGRLSALAFAHDQSLGGEGGTLATLVDAEASLHRFGATNERVVTSGPPIGLDDRAFGVMALLLHEMMTNAAKYGSLSVPEGTLHISWTRDQDGHCVIDWIESGGPAVTTPEKTGFGSTLIDNTIAYDLGGKADLQYAPGGVRARFSIPAIHVREVAPSTRAADRPLPLQRRVLAGKDVVLVEDQALIAMDIEDVLRKLGALSVRAFPNIADALAGIVASEPHCAVLDLNLAGETSAEIADALLARSVPFIFATGYRDAVMIPERFRHIPVVRKPLSERELAEQLAAVLMLSR